MVSSRKGVSARALSSSPVSTSVVIPGAVDDDLVDALPRIVDDGSVHEVLAGLPPDADPIVRSLLMSCADYLAGAVERAAARAREVGHAIDREGDRPLPLVEAAVRHLLRVALAAGDPASLADARRLAEELLPGALPSEPTEPLEELRRLELVVQETTASVSQRRGAAAARLATLLVARDEPERALALVERHREDLVRAASPRELALLDLVAAEALDMVGRGAEASAIRLALEREGSSDHVVSAALADQLDWHGDPAAAARVRRDLAALGRSADLAPDTPLELPLDPVGILRSTARAAAAAVAMDAQEASAIVHSLHVLAARSGAPLWVRVARVLDALRTGESLEVALGPSGDGGLVLGMVAPAVVARLASLPAPSAEVVRAAALQRPGRWAPFVRRAVVAGRDGAQRLAAARLLALLGSREDVTVIESLLADLRPRGADAQLARTLARRVAPRILVEDLGRVGLEVDGCPLPRIGRRKVLGLLCFLVAQPALAATQEQVLEAIWPDQDPPTAGNSLNQTIYFLRRALEPGYHERLTPAYLHHDAEVVWLDVDLVDARSRRCRALIAAARPGSADAVDALADAYTGRFALDFSYEPWAEPHRESLHASYLATMEAAIGRATDEGDLERAVRLAQRTLEIDPQAEGIELALLRLYRRTGAHAAAAEQYSHYATVLRDELGIEPPPLASL